MLGHEPGPVLEGIRRQVTRLGAVIEAPHDCLPTYERSEHSGRPSIEVTEDGGQHWVVWERGREYRRRTTFDRDELLYWVFESVTGEMAARYELAHRVEGEDFRRQVFAHQLELLAKLDPEWRRRRIRELGRLVTEVGLTVP